VSQSRNAARVGVIHIWPNDHLTLGELHSPPVPLDFHDPAWRKLHDALASLVAESGGEFAFVIDVGNLLWCIALAESDLGVNGGVAGAALRVMRAHRLRDFTKSENRAPDRFYQSEMVPRLTAMRRGTRLNVEKTEGADRYLAISFAGIYVLVVWFEEEFPPSAARALIRRALPEIEALTLTLPPSGGPGFDEGAQKIRA
jgi:hypothetical protein